jgi:hypothetical protein
MADGDDLDGVHATAIKAPEVSGGARLKPDLAGTSQAGRQCILLPCSRGGRDPIYVPVDSGQLPDAELAGDGAFGNPA